MGEELYSCNYGLLSYKLLIHYINFNNLLTNILILTHNWQKIVYNIPHQYSDSKDGIVKLHVISGQKQDNTKNIQFIIK